MHGLECISRTNGSLENTSLMIRVYAKYLLSLVWNVVFGHCLKHSAVCLRKLITVQRNVWLGDSMFREYGSVVVEEATLWNYSINIIVNRPGHLVGQIIKHGINKWVGRIESRFTVSYYLHNEQFRSPSFVHYTHIKLVMENGVFEGKCDTPIWTQKKRQTRL